MINYKKEISHKIIWPYIFLYLLSAFIIIDNHSALFIADYVYFPFLFVGSSILFLMKQGKARIADKKIFFGFIYVFISITVVSFFNMGLVDRGTLLSYYVWFFVFFMIMLLPINKETIDCLWKSIIIGALVLSLFIIFLPEHYLYVGSFRFTVKFAGNVQVDPNYVGNFLFVGITAILFFILNNKNRKKENKRYYIITAIPIIIAIVMTGSRGAYLSTIIVFCGYFFEQFKKNKRLLKILITFMMVLFWCIILFDFLPEEIRSRFMLSNWNDSSNSKRISHWINALEAWGKSPILGFGAGHTQDILTKYTGHMSDAHNTFLTFLLHYGLLGGTVLVFIFGRIIKSFIKNKQVFWLGFIVAFIINNTIIANHLGVSFWMPLILLYLMKGYGEKEYVKHSSSSI